MVLQVINGPVIQAGDSLSDGVDCTAGTLIRITMPLGWTSAKLTFQLSSDGNLYNDLVDLMGNEYEVVVVPNSCVRIPREWSPMAAFVKFRSGTRYHPVIQPELRHFAVAVEPDAAI